MTARAAIVVTGTEVLTGRVADRNGPWLAEQLRLHGVDIAQVIVVGDRPADLRWALRTLIEQGLDLVITSGGLGPTADDLTAEIVADVQGRPMVLDTELQACIAAIVARFSAARGWHPDPVSTATAVAKQAMIAEGSVVLEPVGTAPGLVVGPATGHPGPPVVVLPGPPSELQAMWPAALRDAAVTAALVGRQELRQQTIRLWGTAESELAATLRELGDALADLEITTCLRDGELEIVTRYHPSAEPAYLLLLAAIEQAYSATLFSTDGSSIDELVAGLLIDQGRTIATAESCTAGMLASRLADLPGASSYLLGGVVAYANTAKSALVGVDPDLIEAVGAVSSEVAAALADGARNRFGADVGVGITGIAGPGGATEHKPVGLVHVCVTGPTGSLSRRLQLPGSRSFVRLRTTVTALHLIRQLLAPVSSDSSADSVGSAS